MNINDVLNILNKNKNEKYIQKHSNESGGLKSFGLGITKTKKIAREIGKNHKLAVELWKEPIIEMKLLATMIDNPKEADDEQIEKMMIESDYWIISHSLANNLISKYKNINRLFEKWINSKNKNLERGAYLILYEIAKKDKSPDINNYKFLIDKIESQIHNAENFVKDAMNNALIAIGSINRELNEYALNAAKKIGVIEVDYGDNSCQALDAFKHLSSKRIKEKI